MSTPDAAPLRHEWTFFCGHTAVGGNECADACPICGERDLVRKSPVTDAARSREFPLDEILTVSTGCLVSRRHMDAVYETLNFLTGDNLFTHQLPRALEACKPAVLEQHPDLADVVVPDFGEDVHAEVLAWLDTVEAKYGKTRTLVPLADWEHRDAIEEACDLMGAEKVYVFPEAPDGGE